MQVSSHAIASENAPVVTGRRCIHNSRGAKRTPTVENSEDHLHYPSATLHGATDRGAKEHQSARQQDQLFAEFTPLVRRLIGQYGQNAEIRDDLEGEIYYRFCVLLKMFDPSRGVPLRPYLVRQLSAAIYTFARQHWRNQNREVSLELFVRENGPRQSIDPTAEWDNAIDLQQFKRSLPAAISKLSERQRNVLIWRYYEDNSFEAIANRLGIQTATARSLLRHALTQLRADLAPIQ